MFVPALGRRVGAHRVRGREARVLLYSHDTFGLGHLRRSTAIAGALTRAMPGVSALILTGSPVAGRFAFPERVDHVRLPGVVKQPDGDYKSQSLGLHIDETTGLRAALIDAAVQQFEPDLVIVDKEPTGFRGELTRALRRLRDRGRARIVLGIRDVLDDADVLQREWARKNAVQATEEFYDEIWVYGLEAFYDPLAGLGLSRRLARRTVFTGYLKREERPEAGSPAVEEPFVLITPGGGGDGHGLIDWALSAYEADPSLPRAVMVYGPFLQGDLRDAADARASALGDRVQALGFVGHMEGLMARAQGVVAMGGYNTFCEILSFDRPAAIAPRTKPRMEQHIRAAQAERLRMMRMVDRERDGAGPEVMAAAIHALADQAPPSRWALPGTLAGFESIVKRAQRLLGEPERREAEAATG